MVRLQYCGNGHGLIKGIGIVNFLYVKPKTQRPVSLIGVSLTPESDAKSKLTHMEEMFDHAMNTMKLPVRVVLMNSWYATKDLSCMYTGQTRFFTARSRATARSTPAAPKHPTGRRVPWRGAFKKVDQGIWISRGNESQTISGCDYY
jgi:hypothetical protein